MPGLFILPQSLKEDPKSKLAQLADSGINSLNLSMKYHASRHLSIRNQAAMIHTHDGDHFYPINPEFYDSTASLPDDHGGFKLSLAEIDSLKKYTESLSIKLGAWSVFLHDNQFGLDHPGTFVSNLFDQSLQPNLCPINPIVQSYLLGHIRELVELGFQHICFESIGFSGFRHNEHHERYFVNSSLTTEFLLSICFCLHCTALFSQQGIDTTAVKNVLKERVMRSLNDKDPWLDNDLTKSLLSDEFGAEFAELLEARVKGVSDLISRIAQILKSKEISSRFLDSSPISNRISDHPYEDLWQFGLDFSHLAGNFDYLEPLLYRFTTKENLRVFTNYRDRFGAEKLIGAIRPAFPDLERPELLLDRLRGLFEITDGEFDFYLYEIIRDSEWNILSDFLRTSSAN